MAILFVCTGNASRSVMAESMLRVLAPGWMVASAGTHSIEGQPMSWRTRDALARLGYRADWHRSRQAGPEELDRADLVAVFERFQLEWVRREHPLAAPRAASLRRLADTLPLAGVGQRSSAGGGLSGVGQQSTAGGGLSGVGQRSTAGGGSFGGGDLASRVASLGLERVSWEAEEEVVDPGGGEVEAYAACAVEVLGLITALVPRLGPPPG